MKCRKFDYNLYFKLEEYLAQNTGLSIQTPVQILTAIKDYASTMVSESLTDEEVKSFIKVSSMNSELIDKILLVNSNDEFEEDHEEPEESSQPREDHEEFEYDFDSVYQFEQTKLKNINEVVKVNDLHNLYQNYFSGTPLAYNKFWKSFGNSLFSSTYVSFDVNNPFIVKNEKQLNENVKALKGKYRITLIEFLNNKGLNVLEDATLDTINEAFHSLNLVNVDVFNAIAADPQGELSQAYFSYVALNNFESLAPSAVSGLMCNYNNETFEYDYSLSISHKTKNNFSDSLINMVDEVSSLTKKMVEYTPILDSEGKVKYGKYLKLSDLTVVTGKIKSLSGDFIELSMSIRENPEQQIGVIMRKILENPVEALNTGMLNRNDIDVIRSIYNFFYKTGRESGNLLKQMNNETVSLLNIKNADYKLNGVSYNIIADAITTTIDKTIDQKYITLEETSEGIVRQITQDRAINKYYSQLIKNFEERSNIPVKLDSASETAISVDRANGGFSAQVSGNNVKLNIQEYGELEINPIFYNKIDFKYRGKLNKNLTVEEWSKFEKEGPNSIANQEKRNFANIIYSVSKITGLKLYQAGGELISQVNGDADVIVSHLLYNAAKILYFQNLTDRYNQKKLEDPNLELLSFLESIHLTGFENIVNNNKFKPFSEEKDSTLYIQLANATAIVKGDVATAISRNLNGDGLPNTSLLNLIGDDFTIFNQHKKNVAKGYNDMLDQNLFVQNDNFKIIKGTVFRSDIKGRDGKIKNAKAFNASEIMHQAIFSDFWGSMSTDTTRGLAMLEPTVFADKSGQAMKSIDMFAPINFKYDSFNTNGKSMIEMLNTPSSFGNKSMADDLHFFTMKAQYTNLYNKLMSDYKTIFRNASFTEEGRVLLQSVLGNDLNVIDNLNIHQVNDVLKRGFKLETYRKGSAGEVDVQLEIHYANGEVNGYNLKKFEEYQVIDGNKKMYSERMNREDKKFLNSYLTLNGNFTVLKNDGSFTPQMQNIVSFYVSEVLHITDPTEFEKAIDTFKENWVNPDGTLKAAETESGSPISFISEIEVYDEKYKVNINPLLQFMQTSNRALMGNYNLAVVGSPAAHKMKVKKAKVLNTFTPKVKEFILDTNGKKVIDEITGEAKTKLVDNTKYLKNKQKHIFEILKKNLGSEEAALKAIWEEIEESARTIAMHKRMVAYQAKLHPFTQGLISGVTKNMKMLVVQDVKSAVWNTVGDEGGFDVADGSGWIPMVAANLYRNSMGDMGTDSVSLKAIRHAIDGDTGAAHLDKYALQAMSNEVLRQSIISKMPWANMNKIALNTIKFDKVFPDLVGNIFGSEYMFNSEDYVDMIAPNPKTEPEEFQGWVKELIMPPCLNGKPVKYILPGVDILTEVTGIGHLGGKEYIVKKRFNGPSVSDIGITTEEGYTMIVDEEGVPTGEGYKKININSLYDIWSEVFGGMYTVSENEHSSQMSINGVNYMYNDDSNEALATLMNNVVIKKDDDTVNKLNSMGIEASKAETEDYNQANYYQPLKEALIWQINNTSGMKNGAKNVNPNTILYSDSNDQEINYFTTNSMHYGIQGNFDHKFSEEHEARVTEATQVISAAETNGYMTGEVNRLYKSLATVISNSMDEERSALMDKDGKIAEMLTRTLTRIMSSKDRKGIGQAYADLVMAELDKMYAQNPSTFDYSLMEYKMAFSDSNFYSAMVSMVSGALNNSVIKRDLPGIAAVLSQCHDAIMMVDGPNGLISADKALSEYTKTKFKEHKANIAAGKRFEFLKEVADYKDSMINKSYTNATETEIIPQNIDNYDVLRLSANGTQINFEITSPQMYYEVSSGDYSSVPGFKDLGVDPASVKLYKLTNIPRNLKPQRLEFVSEDGVLNLNEMDLDASKAVWMLDKFLKGESVPSYVSSLIERIMDERNLTKNSPKSLIKKELIIEQQRQYALLQKNQFTFEGSVKQGTLTVHAGELILPNYNKSKFGIEDGMNVSDITVDYFYNKFPKAVQSRSTDGSFYLMDKNGKHVYLVTEEELKKVKGYDASNKQMKEKQIDGVSYYVDSKGVNIFKKLNKDMKVVNINGKTYATYKTTEDVNTLNSSDYFLGVGYNFKSSNIDIIKQYVNKFDIASKQYFTSGSVELNARQIKEKYELHSDTRRMKIAQEMMSSWNKQLEMIGARIPAQSLQSFMAMKIVGFTEQDVNRAYVPIKKNYLDGSDFDIDKIYMMGFSINRNGKLQTWTNYFDHNHVEKSLEMPFPTGKLKTLSNEKYKLSKEYNSNLINSYVYRFMNNQPTTEEEFSELVDLLNEIQDSNFIPNIGLSNEAVEYINSFFKTRVTDKTRLIESSKNAAIGSLYKISKAPVNMMSGNRGVDMNDPQAGAEKSPKSWAAMQWSMDNYATLPSMKEENGAGKAVIGISAVGIKNFYALSHMYNQDIMKLDKDFNERYPEFEGLSADEALKKWQELAPFDKESIKDDLRNICNPKAYDLYNESTKTTKRVVTTFLANINLANKPLINVAYSELLYDLRSENSGQNAAINGYKNDPQVMTLKGNWTRKLVSEDPNNIYLFGDNFDDAKNGHVPNSTQAVIRGLENAIGISTKNDRGTSESSYLTDNDFDMFKEHVDSQILKAINLAKSTGRNIILPKDGIGTGKAYLATKAPKLAEYLNNRLLELQKNLGQPIIVNTPHVESNNGENVEKKNIVFNKEQQEAIVGATKFLKSGNPNEFYLIEGKAGTGKTTIAEQIIKRFPEAKVLVSALSHKATQVIKTKFEENQVKADFKTVASLLGMTYDDQTGEFKPDPANKYKKPPISFSDIIMVDEASMINEDALELIMKMKKPSAKVIFMGDIGQLPPIRKEVNGVPSEHEGENSPIFNTSLRSKLLTRVRQGEESPILPFADYYWNNSQNTNAVLDPGKKAAKNIINNEGDLLFSPNFEKIQNQVFDAFKKSKDDKNPNYIKVVTYHKKERKRINTIIHDALFPEDPNTYSVGELITFEDSYNPDQGPEPIFYNSQDGYIESKSEIKTDSYNIRYITYKINSNGKSSDVDVVINNDLDAYKAKRDELFKAYQKAYKTGNYGVEKHLYNSYKVIYGRFDYGYASTSHKAQGSTYDMVIVNQDDINSNNFTTNNGKSQSVYTGITRARNITVMLNSDHAGFDVNLEDENNRINNFKSSNKTEKNVPTDKTEPIDQPLTYELTIEELENENKQAEERRKEKEEKDAEEMKNKPKVKPLPDSIEVIDTRRLDDYSLKLSALLSAATDNAKELILAKINAGPELAGTYVYMLIQGMSFDDITDFMVSPTVDAIVAKSKSNIFTGNKATIDSAIKYYLNGVNVNTFLDEKQLKTLEYQIWNDQKLRKEFFDLLTKEGKEEFTKEDDKGNPTMKNFTRNFTKYFKYVDVNKFISLYDQNFMVNGEYTDDFLEEEDPMDFYQGPPAEIKSYLNRPLQRLFKELKSRQNDLKDHVNMDKVIEFNDIHEQAKEINVLGRRLGINGGMGTDVYSHYSYSENMSNYFCKKVLGLKPEVVSIVMGVEEDKVDEDFIRSITDMRNFHRQVYDKSNLNELFDHSQYQERVINLYDKVKSKFNIVDVEFKLPHYNAMISTQNTAMDIFGRVSTRYEKTLSLMDELMEEGYVPYDNGAKHMYDEDSVKKISNFVISDLTNAFFNSTNIEFTIPKGAYYYDSTFGYSQAKGELQMSLSTPHGRASFKIFMEQNKNLFRRISSNLEGNYFLDNLVSDSQKDSLTGIENSYMKLDIDMNNIKSEFDQIQFQELLTGFEQLKHISAPMLKGKSLADAFFVYNLLVNNNAFGKNSFTKIFENDLQEGEKTLITEFMKYVGDIDNSPNTKTGSTYPETNLDTLALMLAPVMRNEDFGNDQGKYVKKWNNNNKKYDIYIRVEPEEEDEFKRYKYEPYDGLKTYSDVPTRLYLQDAQANMSINLLQASSFNSKVLNFMNSQYKNGDIKILLNC